MLATPKNKLSSFKQSWTLLDNTEPPNEICQNKFNNCEYCCCTCKTTYCSNHTVCEKCYKDSCPLCNLAQNSIIYCQNCCEPSNPEDLPCGHKICSKCNMSGCELCRIFESIERNKCEICKKVFNYTTRCGLHCICQKCFLNTCPLCSELKIKPNLCEACSKYEKYNHCKQGHSLCSKCVIDCFLCHRNLADRRKSSSISSNRYNSMEYSESWDKAPRDLTFASSSIKNSLGSRSISSKKEEYLKLTQDDKPLQKSCFSCEII